jgi:hypothetical protein
MAVAALRLNVGATPLGTAGLIVPRPKAAMTTSAPGFAVTVVVFGPDGEKTVPLTST